MAELMEDGIYCVKCDKKMKLGGLTKYEYQNNRKFRFDNFIYLIYFEAIITGDYHVYCNKSHTGINKNDVRFCIKQ